MTTTTTMDDDGDDDDDEDIDFKSWIFLWVGKRLIW